MSGYEPASAAILGLVERQAVYRCFADDGTLLYIGTTGRLGRRLADHAQKAWFLASTQITLEWFPDEDSALKAERRAIETELPKFNVTHNRAMTVRLPGNSGRRRKPVVFLSASSRPERGVTVREALAAGFLPGFNSYGAVRQAKYLDPDAFPPPLNEHGRDKFYDAEALHDWASRIQEQRTSRRKRGS